MTTLLSEAEAKPLLAKLSGWTLTADNKSIGISWKMKDFKAAIDLVNRITDLAEAMDHHPDLHLTGYRDLRIELSTHSAGGLTEKDFSLASKIDVLPKSFHSA